MKTPYLTLIDHLVLRSGLLLILMMFICCGLLVQARADCKDLRFYPVRQLVSGGSPFSIATGDLNGDSKIDFLLPNPGDSYLSIFYGDGTGRFTEPSKITTASYPHAVTVGDFNGDGSEDLAVLISGSYGVEVFLNNGDGTFGTPTFYLVENDPAHVVTGDFNQDGNLDLAVADNASSTVDVLLGTGTGTFNVAIKSTGTAATGGIVAGDFDEDGVLDLALSDYGTEAVSILHGDGTGHFALINAYNLGSNGGGIAAADFNHDGHEDLAVGVYNIVPPTDDHIAVYLGSGDGNFVLVQRVLVIDSQAVVATDFNNDGNVDLAAATFGLHTVVFTLGDGTGRFHRTVEFKAGGGNFEPLDLAVGDFNGDGRPDVVAADYLGGTATVFVSVPCELNGIEK